MPSTSRRRSKKSGKRSKSDASPKRRNSKRSPSGFKYFRGMQTPKRKRATRSFSPAFTPDQLRSAGVNDEEEARDLMKAFAEAGGDETLGAEAPPPSMTVEMAETKEGILVPKSMADLISYVENSKFKESWRTVIWFHLKNKLRTYQAALLEAMQEVTAREEKIDVKVRKLNVPQEERWKSFSDDSALDSAMDRASQFQVLVDHITTKIQNLEDGTSFSTLNTNSQPLATRVSNLKSAILSFAKKSKQHEICDFTAKLILAFFQNPFFPRNKFFTFLFVGPPGTGKTTIAKDISKVLVACGLFEGGFYDKGKSDFIGQYLGETPHKTSKSLTAYALEGVLFIDEAYTLCNLDDKGNIDMYGLEFATTLVDFMTRYRGFCCIIAAGYEPEMKAQFLAANDGLPRRFPHRFLLEELNESQLSNIISTNSGSVFTATSPEDVQKGGLDDDVLVDVQNFIKGVKAAKKEYPHLYTLIKNSAGSASNISEFLATYSEGKSRSKYFKPNEGILNEEAVVSSIRKSSPSITSEDFLSAIRSMLSQAEMSQKSKAISELDRFIKKVRR